MEMFILIKLFKAGLVNIDLIYW